MRHCLASPEKQGRTELREAKSEKLNGPVDVAKADVESNSNRPLAKHVATEVYAVEVREHALSADRMAQG